MSPLFTVIIPTFNRAALIGRTLASVLAQPAQEEIEVIVVDDGSTDGTLGAVAAFAGRVGLLRQENRGPGSARNAGLTVAAGDYVAFLDSGDLWLPWAAQTYAAVIDQYHRPAFVAGKPLVFDGEPPHLPTPPPLTTAPFADYLASGDRRRCWGASSFVMRRDLLVAAGGFTDDWVNAEDADAALRMGTAGPFVQVTDPPTFAWRRHAPSSATPDGRRALAGVRRLIDQEAAGRYPGGPGRARDRRRIIATVARSLSRDLLAHDPPAGWDLYRRTLRWNLSLGRLRYLASFPVRAAGARLRGRGTSP
jgi:hypothetical protein